MTTRTYKKAKHKEDNRQLGVCLVILLALAYFGIKYHF